MTKKTLISLGFLSIIAITSPIIVAISCSSEAPIKDELKITAKTSPKIIKPDISILEGKDPSVQLPILKKLFDGTDLTSENQNKFSISIDKNKKIVTLTSKPGYTINGKDSIASNTYTIETIAPTNNLIITTILTAATLKLSEVTDLQGTNAVKQFPILKKLFDGKDLNTQNQSHFTVSVNTNTKIVTLTAAEGYTISGKTSLSSTAYKLEAINPTNNLTITAIAKPGIITGTEITTLQGSISDAQLTTLKKLFEGKDLTPQNQANFSILVDSAKNIIILTAKDGYAINNKGSLNSNIYTFNLTIAALPTAADLNIIEVADLEKQNTPQQLTVLKKLFSGEDLIDINQNSFIVAVDTSTKIVTLTAKENYKINNQESLKSTVYKDKKINLGINNKDHQVSFDAQWDIALKTPSPTITAAQTVALGYLFQFVTPANVQNLTFSIVKETNVVTITAKNGYTFVENGVELPSLTAMPYKIK
ncbi:MAG: hypothetical protein ACRDAW_00855 [Metamycoplasmataceae bacterium]